MSDTGSDSGIDMDMTSEYTSINSTNYQFHEEGGRRFHGTDAPYKLPNDGDELSRLQDEHHYHKAYHEVNILAPLPQNPSLIVDIGTGSGIWCIEVANEYPDCSVVGTDLSPVQPTTIPENCDFYIESLLDGLNFPTGSVDYIQTRTVGQGIPAQSWPPYIAEVYRVLKPGSGWATFLEIGTGFKSDDGSLSEDSAINRWQKYIMEALAKMGIDLDIGRRLGSLVKEQPFVDVKVEEIKMPHGPWSSDEKGKIIGAFSRRMWSKSPESSEPLMWEVIPNADERSAFIRQLQMELSNPDYHIYCTWHLVIGRKPEVNL